MTNAYIKIIIEKIWGSQIFDFVSLKNLSPGQIWGAPTHKNIIEF